MRTVTTSILTDDGVTRALSIQYPNSIAFMYSRQPVIVTFTSGASGVTGVSVTVSGSGGKTHTETRTLRSSKAEFDISRTLQLLSTDVDVVTRRLDLRPGTGLSALLSLTVTFTTSDGLSHNAMLNESLTLMYGALDQGEIYGEHTQRRLWVNFPQTFNLWENADGEVAFVTDDTYVYPSYATGYPSHEVDFMDALAEAGQTELIESLRNGVPLHNVGLSWRKRIEDGVETDEELRTVTMIPDCRKRTDGTYLRWINRRGELSYWLFTNSKLRVTTAVQESFSRYYEGDPAAPDRQGYRNPQKATYREAREMMLGATGLSLDEFEDLCDLASSPVVERLMLIDPEDTGTDIVYDGNSATLDSTNVVVQTGEPDEVEGGDATTAQVEEVIKWQRVNVVAGAFERNIRRNTPSLQDLEILIELPERNTIQL